MTRTPARPLHPFSSILQTLLVLFSITFLLSPVSAFSFNTTTPTQCNDLTVKWDGGTEPFHLLIVPTNTVNTGHIVNVSIPMGSNGAYTFTLPEPAGMEMLITMWDATGFGAGGTTSVLTVGSSSNSSCLDNDVLADFYFSLNPDYNPNQCSTMAVSWNTNVSLPVSLYGLIPSGSAFSIPVPQGSPYDYNWTVDIASGTQFLLLMSDSGVYQTGGSSGLFTVQSGDSSCLNSSSPSSATSSGGGTGTGTATASGGSASASNIAGVGGSSSGGSSEGSSTTSGGSKTNVGAIVGGVVGGIVGLVIVAALLYFFCIRPRRQVGDEEPGAKSYSMGFNEKSGRKHARMSSLGGSETLQGDGMIRPTSTSTQPFDIDGDETLQPSPFVYPATTANGDRQVSIRGDGGAEVMSEGTMEGTEGGVGQVGRETAAGATPRTSHGGSGGGSGGGKEAMRASEQRDSGVRLVQHEDGGNIVELPPRYDQLRARNADVGDLA